MPEDIPLKPFLAQVESRQTAPPATEPVAAAPMSSGGSVANTLKNIVLAALPQLRPAATEPDILWANLRAAASAALATLPFPSQHLESWKYTNFRALHDPSWFAPPPQDATDAPRTARFAANNSIQLHNGRLYRADVHRLQLLQLKQAVSRSMDAAQPESASAWRALFTAGACEAFACLNALTATDPLIVQIPADTDAGTLRVSYTTSHSEQSAHQQFHCATRLGVRLAPGSTLTLIEELTPSVGLHNSVTDIELGAGATLKHIRWTNLADTTLSLGRVFVRIGANANYAAHQQLDMGAQIREELDVALQGSGARASLSGAACIAGRDQADLIVRLRHEAPHTRSTANYRGLAGERGRLAFNGRIHILPNAMDVDASLTNKNLLLSRDAEIDTKPELEIYADDVRCSHGATVGQIDANALFFLQSRGIEPAAASVLLRRGFALGALSAIAEGAEREVLMNLLLERLEEMA